MAARKTTALQTAMTGGKVSDRQAQGALSQAVDKITSLTRRAQKSKEVMAETGAMVLHSAETQGSLFLASMAEGYLGEDKLKLGAVDMRAPLAILAQGYGLYEAMSGKAGGGHALALGNGIMGSWLASVAVRAGQTLASKRSAATPAVSVVQGYLPAPGMDDVTLVQGPMREVLLTPEPEPRRPRREGRFVRAERDDD